MPAGDPSRSADSPGQRRVAYLGLGSNLGDRRDSLTRAVASLAGESNIDITRVSLLYETEPVGLRAGQPEFLNAALEIETTLAPQGLLARCLRIETELGRRRGAAGGGRTIDIDVLMIDGLGIESPDLIVPHPRMHRRRFVLVPLAEIAPRAVHSLLNQPVRQLLDDLDDRHRVAAIPSGQWWRDAGMTVGCQR